MLGTKIYKTYIENPDGGLGFWDYDEELYVNCAESCNETQLTTIEDKGEYYEVVEISAPSLDELKTAKIAEFKTQRNAEEVMPIEWDGNLYDYDSNSRERMRIKRQDIEDNGGTGKILWILANNEKTEIGLDDFKGINSAAAERSEALHDKYNSLKAQVEVATSNEELENIVW